MIRGAARAEMVWSSRSPSRIHPGHPPINPLSTLVNPSVGALGVAASYGDIGRLGGAWHAAKGWSMLRLLSQE
jgi:hypothetical protein